jgi:hypothetical protein
VWKISATPPELIPMLSLSLIWSIVKIGNVRAYGDDS